MQVDRGEAFRSLGYNCITQSNNRRGSDTDRGARSAEQVGCHKIILLYNLFPDIYKHVPERL